MCKKGQRFEIKPEHLKLLKNAYVRWEDCEYGAPSIDCKRPYGNSSVEEDIADILGWTYDVDEGLSKDQSETAERLHKETETVLQICLTTQTFQPGVYELTKDYDSTSWIKV